MVVYGTMKGALRRVPLGAPVPDRGALSEAEHAKAVADVEMLNTVQVIVRNRGRADMIVIQRKAAELERELGAFAASEFIVQETVLGLEGFAVVSAGLFAEPEEQILLGPGVDVERLVSELDANHMLELVALAGLRGQAPSPRQRDF